MPIAALLQWRLHHQSHLSACCWHRVGFATDLGAVRRFQPPASGGSTGSTGWDSSSCGGGGRGPGAAEGSRAGWGRSTGSRHDNGGGLDPNDLFPIIKEAGEEVGQRLTNPLRFWLRHISPVSVRELPACPI